MKKYIIVLIFLSIRYILYDYMFFYRGDIYFSKNNKIIECVSSTKEEKLLTYENIEYKINGIRVSSFSPGEEEAKIEKSQYKKWFKQISNLGINAISVRNIQNVDFYEAIYEYNENNNNPIYIIQGISVDETIKRKNVDVTDKNLNNNIEKSYKDTINAIHGRLKKGMFMSPGKQYYKKDVSKWVYSYVLYTDWEADLVKYNNMRNIENIQYIGKYLYTENATRFENFLASIGDKVIEYETDKYGVQRNLSYIVYAENDPLEYSENYREIAQKYSEIDLENIKCKDTYKSGIYASYNIYPYAPEYTDEGKGIENLYKEYIIKLNQHHKMPVVISEYGVPSSRGIAAYETNKSLGRDYGNLTEKEQGEAILSMYKDIMESGSNGCILNCWQDEWQSRTWNTTPMIDTDENVYWNDYQTPEKNLGLLAFEPGVDKEECYTDGKISEWDISDLVIENELYSLSMKYDEKYLYYMIDLKKNISLNTEIFIPIDITPKSGGKYISKFDINTDRGSDFLICIDGKFNSRLLVHERYDSLEAIYGHRIKHKYNQFINKPQKNSDYFKLVESILYEKNYYFKDEQITMEQFINNGTKHTGYYTTSQKFEIGRLVYGNGNPESKDFNSLSDFCFGKDCIEIRIPWQLLNFYNPSKMEIHDDYYECYGVEPISIDSMYVGVGNIGDTIKMEEFPLEGWGKKVTYHERLKESYYILKDYWSKN